MPPKNDENTPESPEVAPGSTNPTPGASSDFDPAAALREAVAALKELREDPTPEALELYNEKLAALGLPGVDASPGPWNPWADRRLGSTVNVDALRTGVRAVSDEEMARLEAGVEDEASDSERWGEVLGTLVAVALKIGAAFA